MVFRREHPPAVPGGAQTVAFQQERSSTGAPDQPPPPLSVFINYRRSDASSAAGRLYDHLVPELGEANVFLDVAVLKPGMDWRKEINASVKSSGALLVVIGSRWLSALHERGQLGAVGQVDDVARKEIEDALTNSVDVSVVPVLVDGASMPPANALPPSLRPLSETQYEQLGDATYRQDVTRLIERLRRIGSDPKSAVGSDGARTPVEIPREAPSRYRKVAESIVGREQMVIMLGSGVNASCVKLPDADRLATALARAYGYRFESQRPDLAEVAQYVSATRGDPDLYRALQESLTVDCEINDIHRFLAALPKTTEVMGYPRQYQLLVTTNYDVLLEEAFREAQEPFDLVVYLATGTDKGKFVHFPWQDTPRVISPANTYSELPFHQDFELWRTLILKIHGAVDMRETPYGWENNFVVTEDNYIDYLSGGSIGELIPVQILGRLRRSHCLFLGYDIREWSLRVFLKRVWGAQIRARSWAVQGSPEELDEELWRQTGVVLLDEPVDEYIRGLSDCLTPAM
jgi:hypothetical protein